MLLAVILVGVGCFLAPAFLFVPIWVTDRDRGGRTSWMDRAITCAVPGLFVSLPAVALVWTIGEGRFWLWPGVGIGLASGVAFGLLARLTASLYDDLLGSGISGTHAWFSQGGGYFGPATGRDVHEHYHGHGAWRGHIVIVRLVVQVACLSGLGVGLFALFSQWETVVGFAGASIPTLLVSLDWS